MQRAAAGIAGNNVCPSRMLGEEMKVSDNAVEAAARVAYAVKPAKYYLDDSVVTWERLDDSRSGQLRKDQELAKMRAALEAAAPHLIQAAAERAWNEGWIATGSTPDENPYRKAAT
jgi:hypothetical protein